MKVPAGLLDPQGQVAKGYVHIEANDTEAQEFGLTVTGKHSTCYVLVSPGDVITAHLALNSGITGEFADLVVDGVLRNSWPNNRGHKVFSYIFDRAVYAGNLIGGTKRSKAAKFSRMQVIERNTLKDLPLDGKPPSPVSSIKVQVFRKEAAKVNTDNAISGKSAADVSGIGTTNHGSGSGSGNGDADSGDTTADSVDAATPAAPGLDVLLRDPDFTMFPTWQDVSRHIDSKSVPSPFEIGFFDSTGHWQKPKKRVLQKYSGDYKLWASFTFLLRSAANLHQLGFPDARLHCSPNPPASNTFASTAGPSKAAGVAADDSVDTLFEDDEGEDALALKAVIKPKKAPAKKKSKKAVAEALTTSTTDQLTKKTKEDKVNEPSTASTTAAKESKTMKSNSEPEIRGPETREQFIARKKAELILPGVKGDPAQYAWNQKEAAQRAATLRSLEEPEDDDEDMADAPANSVEKGLVEVLSSGLKNALHTSSLQSKRLSISQTQILPTYAPRARRLSSPPALALPLHIQDERRPSVPMMASSAPSSPRVSNYAIPNFSSGQRALIAQILPIHDPGDRHPALRAVQSEPRPSTPLSPETDIFSMPGFSSSLISKSHAAELFQGLKQRRPSFARMTSSRPSTPLNGEKDMPYLVPSFVTSPRSGSHGFSATTTPDGRQSTHSVACSLRQPVTGPHAHRYSESYDPALSFSQVNCRAPEDVATITGYQTGRFAQKHSQFMQTKSRRTTRPSTPDQSEKRTEPRPKFESQYQIPPGIESLLSPISAPFRHLGPNNRARDSEIGGTARPSSPIQPRTQLKTVNQEEHRIFAHSQPVSPVPSETPTELVTEVASPSAVDLSRMNGQRRNSNDSTFSQTKSSAHPQPLSTSFYTPQASFNHTTESPILGSSPQLLPVAPEMSALTPVAVQARLYSLNCASISDKLPKGPEVQRAGRVVDQEQPIENLQGRSILHEVKANRDSPSKPTIQNLQGPSIREEPKANQMSHSEPTTQRTEIILISPPPLAQKRKADSITGGDSTSAFPPHKIPSQDQNLIQHEREKAAPVANNAGIERLMEQSESRLEETRRQYEAAQRQQRDSQPRWEEEIRRQNEVARARMTAATQQRLELQARYEVALAIQKERERVNELNKKAERLEHENAELQAKIAALCRGESV